MLSRMILVVCLVLAFVGTGNAAVPTSIAMQGRLTDASGIPLAPGSKSFSFRVFNAASIGTQLWPAGGVGEVQNLTTDAAGVWIGLIGAVSPLSDAVFADSVRWLEVTVDGTTLPRMRLVTGPYAYRVATVDGASGGTVTGRIVVTGSQEGVRIQGPGVGEANAAWVQFNDAVGTAVGFVGDADVNDPDLYLGSYLGDVHLYTPVGDVLRGDPAGRIWIGPPPIGNSTVNIGRRAADFNAVNIDGNGHHGLAVTTVSTGQPADAIFAAASSGHYAGYFNGDVRVQGTLTKDAGAFKIDHPLDPANKYLSHSFVESPDMMNIYNGNVTLDVQGEAVIILPEWFGALNKDFRYQLTAIGAPGPNLYIAQEIAGNQFRIAGGAADVKVSWQVTGIRQDAYANAHRIPVEEAKPDKERGFYLHPELFSQPEEKSIEWTRRPEMMKEMKEQREKAGIDKR